MADNSKNILKKLQQLNLQPPADAFDKAWGIAVPKQNSLPDSQNPIPENMEQKIFTSLQDYSMDAPPLNFIDLKNKAAENTTSIKPSKQIPAYLTRAAALFLILAAAIALYFTVSNKKENAATEYATGNKNNTAPNVVDNNKSNDTLATAIITAGPVTEDKRTIAPLNENRKKEFLGRGVVKKQNKSKVTFSNGGEAKLYDNDVLLTLASYSGNDWKQFFTNAVEDKRITLNKYSYLNLSDKMVEMLQNTYLTKKNGNPSRKAKRTKKKFEKWRKKDEKYFDKNMRNNPTDIIDLSDFTL